LHLDYKAHAAGIVNVTMQGDDGHGSTASDTFTITQPNLVASFGGDPFDSVIIGGDAGSPLVIGNSGGGWAGPSEHKGLSKQIHRPPDAVVLIQRPIC
jgi:hypothetical protein